MDDEAPQGDEPRRDRNAEGMAAIDAALEPVRRLAATPQPMNTAHLGVVVSSFRQAITTLVYGPPEPIEQPVVENPKAEAQASLVAGKSEPQFAEQPDDGTAGEDEPVEQPTEKS
jgi:hypothetical protein